MSARDELFKRVTGSFLHEDRVNALIDAFAHELAEQIREEACRPSLILRVKRPDDPTEVAQAMAARMADLIDPYTN